MLLFHGSNQVIEKINLLKCRKYKDFGCGFYLTTLNDQALNMAERTALRFGGSPIVSCFEFNKDCISTLNVKIFHSVSRDWAEMIINNRNATFKDFKNCLSNHDNKYDIVVGSVANDDISRIFALYQNGILRMDQLSEELKYKKLNNQYSFYTEKALDF